MDIAHWIMQATERLKQVGVDSARLDAELILAETLRKPRTYLHAHTDEPIDPRRDDIATARLALREERVPLAYILGRKEFYGRTFFVTPDVLVPRPESEDVIALFCELAPSIKTPKTLIDVGTGSGCLGITAALERPMLRVILSDISRQALNIAQKNAISLHASVHTRRQSLLSEQIEPLDYIFANLPYVDESWDTSPELLHEPPQALYAKKEGLELIFRLIDQTPRHLNKSGLLFIEADPVQHQRIIAYATENRLTHIATKGYCCAFQKNSTR